MCKYFITLCRFRHRDFRSYPENNKKVPSSIYDLQPDYMCPYRRSSQEYERNPDFTKNHENDEANQNDTKEVRQNRDVWDQEKDVDTKEKDVKIEPESHVSHLTKENYFISNQLINWSIHFTACLWFNI